MADTRRPGCVSVFRSASCSLLLATRSGRGSRARHPPRHAETEPARGGQPARRPATTITLVYNRPGRPRPRAVRLARPLRPRLVPVRRRCDDHRVDDGREDRWGRRWRPGPIRCGPSRARTSGRSSSIAPRRPGTPAIRPGRTCCGSRSRREPAPTWRRWRSTSRSSTAGTRSSCSTGARSSCRSQIEVPVAATVLHQPCRQALRILPGVPPCRRSPPASRIRPRSTTARCPTTTSGCARRIDPEVRAYLEAENAYTDEVMQPTKPLQEALYAEMLGRIKQTDLSVPSASATTSTTRAREEGQQYPYMCRRGRRRRTRPRRCCSISTRWHRAIPTCRSRRLRRQRRPALAGLFARHHRLPPVRAAGQGPADGRGARRADRAGRRGGLGERQPDAVLHDRGRGLEALQPGVAARARRAPAARSCSRSRTSCTTSAPAARSTSRCSSSARSRGRRASSASCRQPIRPASCG